MAAQAGREISLTPEERAEIEKLGFEKLMETLRQRLAEQKGRHQGGSKWIGTGGTSPFGAYGDHPEGVRIGQDKGRRGSAVKVWDKREFKDFAGDEALGPRNIRIALRRLRRFAREGAEDELDLDGTIRSTADKGYIDVKLGPSGATPSRCCCSSTSAARWIGTSRTAQALFSAARLQFKRLEHFYFHNCLYESVWRDNRRRFDERTPTAGLLNAYGRDHRAIFVGDASMSPHEILSPGGSVEHLNPEPGATWLKRVVDGLAAQRLDQPDAAGPLGLFALDAHHIVAVRRSNVRADARRPGSGDADAVALAGCPPLPLSRERVGVRARPSSGPSGHLLPRRAGERADHFRTTSTEHCAWRTIVLAFEPNK